MKISNLLRVSNKEWNHESSFDLSDSKVYALRPYHKAAGEYDNLCGTCFYKAG